MSLGPGETRRIRITAVLLAGIIGATAALIGLLAGSGLGLLILPIFCIHAWWLGPAAVAGMRGTSYRAVVILALATGAWTVVLAGLAGLLAGAASGADPGELLVQLVAGAFGFALSTVLPAVATMTLIWAPVLNRLER